MEVCGGHTHSIFRYGIEGLLAKGIEMVHGPGCPVCALPMGRIDDAIAIAERPEVIFTTFGDALRVPGSKKSLVQAKAEGCGIRIVCSPMDALDFARAEPEREVVPRVSIADPKSCQCGEVLKGVLKPRQCKVFGTACKPETPVGTLMVSSEGACAAYHRYAGARAERNAA